VKGHSGFRLLDVAANVVECGTGFAEDPAAQPP